MRRCENTTRAGRGHPNKPDNRRQTPLSYGAWHSHDGVVRMLLARTRSALRTRIIMVEHRSCMLLRMNMKEWLKFISSERWSIPTSQIMAEPHYRMLLRVEWGSGENSPQAGKVNPDEPDDHGGTPLPYRTVLRMDVREW